MSLRAGSAQVTPSFFCQHHEKGEKTESGKTRSPLYPSFPHHHPKIPFRIPSRNCCSNLNNYLESSAAINHVKTNSIQVL